MVNIPLVVAYGPVRYSLRRHIVRRQFCTEGEGTLFNLSTFRVTVSRPLANTGELPTYACTNRRPLQLPWRSLYATLRCLRLPGFLVGQGKQCFDHGTPFPRL